MRLLLRSALHKPEAFRPGKRGRRNQQPHATHVRIFGTSAPPFNLSLTRFADFSSRQERTETGDHMDLKAFYEALVSDQSGATAVEYGLIAALIVVGMLTALLGLADSSSGMWGSIESEATTAMN
ncbi:MAG: Flp family type IVb pilin [Erythrobacter sp.]